jgi:hemolysin-activating ACP:hemolysin acyltransferase
MSNLIALATLVRMMGNAALQQHVNLLRCSLLIVSRAGHSCVIGDVIAFNTCVLEQRCDIFFDALGRQVGVLAWDAVDPQAPPGERRLIHFRAIPGYENAMQELHLAGILHTSDSADACGAPDSIFDMRKDSFLQALVLGRCLLLMASSPLYQPQPLRRFTQRLLDVIGMAQYKLYGANSADGSAGLLTWAWVSTRTVSRLSTTPLHAAHSSEWREGTELCVCDAVMSAPARAEIYRDILSALFPEQQTVLLYLLPALGRNAGVIRLDRSRPDNVLSTWLQEKEIRT